jgi:hypothetical protein
MNNTFENMTTVFHVEYGKGFIVGNTTQGRTQIYMCFFPKANEHDWINHRALATGTDDWVSLEPIEKPVEPTEDDLQQAISNLFFGGQPPQSGM